MKVEIEFLGPNHHTETFALTGSERLSVSLYEPFQDSLCHHVFVNEKEGHKITGVSYFPHMDKLVVYVQ